MLKMPPSSQNKGSKRSKGSFGRCICRPSYIAATCFLILLLFIAVSRFKLNPLVSEMKGLHGFTSKDVAEPHANSHTAQVLPHSHTGNSNANSIGVVTDSSTQRSGTSVAETSDSSMKKKKKTSPPKKAQSKNKAIRSNKNSKSEKQSSNGKRQKKTKNWLYDGVYNFEPYWGLENKTYIRVIPSEKIPLKWERMILFPSNISIDKSIRPNEPPSGVVGRPRDLLLVEELLERHPLRKGVSSSTLEEVIFALQSSATCIDKPIFLTVSTFNFFLRCLFRQLLLKLYVRL